MSGGCTVCPCMQMTASVISIMHERSTREFESVCKRMWDAGELACLTKGKVIPVEALTPMMGSSTDADAAATAAVPTSASAHGLSRDATYADAANPGCDMVLLFARHLVPVSEVDDVSPAAKVSA